MTVSSQISKNGPYDCNGSQVAFPFTFKVFTKNDLIVVLTDIATDIETDLVVDTNYTVSLNADQNNNPGGTVTTVTTYPTGQKITIARNVAFTQQVSITNFRPDVFERAFDKLTMLVQQLSEAVSRSVKIKLSSEVSPDDLLTAIDNSVGLAETAANTAEDAAAAATVQALDAQASANAAAASAEALPNVSGGANTVPTVNPTGNGWLYKTATQFLTFLGILDSTNDASGLSTSATAPVSPSWLKSGFAISLTTNGYIKAPNWIGGWIFNWGTFASSSGGDTVVTFPLSYTSACYCVIATSQNNAAGGFANVANPPGVSLSSFSGSAWASSSTRVATPVFWWAFGK